MSTRTPADRPKRPGKAAASRPSAAGMRITYLIGQLDRIVSRRLSEVLSQHGLTLAQYTALSVLRARGRASNAQLAERSFITPQSANVVVKTMQANGWVTREHDPANRRIVLLSLTPTGEALLDICNAKADRIERVMLDKTGDEAAQSLQLLLHACVRNLRAA